jgi:hypothetical protein
MHRERGGGSGQVPKHLLSFIFRLVTCQLSLRISAQNPSKSTELEVGPKTGKRE